MTGTDPAEAEFRRRFEQAVSGTELADLRRLATVLTSDLATPVRPELRRPPLAGPMIYHVRAELRDSNPPIWRTIALRSDLPLEMVHHTLQMAFVWSGAHLYRFSLGGDPFDRSAQIFLCEFDVEEEDPADGESAAAADVRLDEVLQQPGDVLNYVYDYGDHWDITLRLEQVLPMLPGDAPALVVDGARAAPPEDCGGLRDAESLAEFLYDPELFDAAELNAWLLDPGFRATMTSLPHRLVIMLMSLSHDEAALQLLERLIDLPEIDDDPVPVEALAPIQWFLDAAAGNGLEMTSAGYLKPARVSEAAAMLPGMSGWIGAVNREGSALPLLRFRLTLQRLGLLRVYNGRLKSTRLGKKLQKDPAALWAGLAGLVIPSAEGFERDAALLMLAYAATDERGAVPADEVASMLTRLGWQLGDHGPILGHHLYQELSPVLQNLGDSPTLRQRISGLATGPSGSRLARAALMADGRKE
ncbi:plasmid pRiA4b ORF-3 family protein [Tessaracoccus sp. MC1679]|uniref:plasmid pRiA4b ORF-3 family protein n=1 Tax=Tessaracoccus sp. MC1679 TaxID=2760313 RepID=UPI0016028834|nr:plasmid pRiA4b ORF-3 family protein [Tessaracoccus sp. MC1679]MBB1516180.1 plasmid pRiA4b ORF-3 family protein [Tessaracoccus sp. MC1679]